MATIAEMFVDIGADASQFDRETKDMQSQMKGMQSEMKTMAQAMGTSSTQMSKDWQSMSNEMKMAMKASQESLKPFKQAQQEVQFGFFKMAQGMKDYQGTNAQFMDDVLAMGKAHKTATENMMKNNDLLKMSFIQSVGTMVARSGQSEKIAANFTRMGNPLYTVNNGLLKITSNLEGIARAGTPAVLALSMLGPTANMKELQDMTMLIQRGLMRFASVAIAAGITSALMFAGLHKAAKDSVPGYQAALEEMGAAVREAFQPMVDVFGAVMIKVYEFITVIANLVNKFNEAHPVLAKVIQGFLMLIPLLTLILSPLAIGIGMFAGLKAAFGAVWMLIGPLVTGLGAMLGTVLLVAAGIAIFAVALWALWTKVDGFKENVLGAWETIKSATLAAWNWIYTTAIKPAIDAIVSFVQSQLTYLKTFWDQNGQMILQAAQNVWNVIATVIKGVMIVIGAIMSVMWPIIKSLIMSTWDAIKNVIEGSIKVITGIIKFFAALFTGNWKALWAATKQILVGAVQLIWGLINLWFVGKFIGGFKVFASAAKGIFTAFWTTVKAIFSTVFNAIKNSVTGTANGIRTVLTTVFNAVRSTITTILNGIRSIFTSVWNGIKVGITGVVNSIRVTISTVFNAIKAIVTSVLNGIRSTFTSIWSGIKSVVQTGVNGVKSTIKTGIEGALNLIKGLGSSFKAAGKGLIDMMAAGIGNAAGKVIGEAKKLAGKVRDLLPFSPAKDGPLSDLDRLDFGGPIADSLKRGMPTVQSLMTDMVTMPGITAPTMPSYSTQAFAKEKAAQTVVVELDGRTIARGTLPHMEREIRLKTGLRMN